jgi:hypothetical protein
MSIHLRSRTLGSHPPPRKPLIAAAGGVLVALAVATGIGAWQLTEGDTTQTAAVRAPSVPAAGAAAQHRDQRVAEQPRGDVGAHTPAGAMPARTVFIVTSPAEAAFIRGTFGAAETTGATPSIVALVLDTAITEADDILRAVGADAQHDQPVVQVVDLRGR